MDAHFHATYNLAEVICGNWEDVSEISDYGDIVELNRAWMSASVQAIANQTLRHSPAPSEFAQKFNGRIQALARANSMLSDATWQCASLRNLLRDQLQLGTIDEAKLQISGPDVDLDPQSALHLALVIHELDTNANKYGHYPYPPAW
jgi:two-component sensor histidine kinase